MSESLCDDCKNNNKKSNEKPCSNCIQWVDGYLEAINYEPNIEP
jgi:hypothetical protein